MAKKTKKSKEESVPEVEQIAPVVVAENAPTTIYIGKTVYGLVQYTVFKNGILPPFVEELAKKDETIMRNIIPLTELQTARDARKRARIVTAYTNKQ